MALHERIKQIRTMRNLTQKEVANKLGIARGTYSNYETGLREPDAKTIVTLAELFGVTTDFLLGRYTEEEKNFLRDIDELSLEDVMEKYHLKIDGREATREEIEEMIAYIKARRIMKKMHE